MRQDKYIAGLKRELAGRCARQGGAAADEVLRELAANGEKVETRSAAKPKRAAAKPKADANGEE
jgi:hypothetical protein